MSRIFIVFCGKTHWNVICHILPDTPLLIPFVFEGDEDGDYDNIIHTTPGSVQLINRKAMKKRTGKRFPRDKKLTVTDKEGRNVFITDGVRFIGMDGRRFINSDDAVKFADKTMCPKTIVNSEKSYLCCFTDFRALFEIFGEDVRVCVTTYDDLITHMDDKIGDGDEKISGLSVNPRLNELVLTRGT